MATRAFLSTDPAGSNLGVTSTIGTYRDPRPPLAQATDTKDVRQVVRAA